MNERTAQSVWLGGSLAGAMVVRGLRRLSPTASLVAAGVTAVWFLAGLARDNFLFKKEVAAQRERLAERRAAVRAAKEEAARRRAQNKPPL